MASSMSLSLSLPLLEMNAKEDASFNSSNDVIVFIFVVFDVDFDVVIMTNDCRVASTLMVLSDFRKNYIL